MSDPAWLRTKQAAGNAKDWVVVRLRSMSEGKSTPSAIIRLVTSAIGYISSIFAFSVLLKDLAGFDGAEELCKQHWRCLIIVGLLASLVHNRAQISCKGAMAGDDFQVEVRVSDLFDVGASSFVIPTNTYFHTKMDGEYISPQSVQGAFQIRYFGGKTDELDKLIDDNLSQQGVAGADGRGTRESPKRYPVGTVAKVDHSGKHYYFVAVNDVNRYGKPKNQEYANVETALRGLIKAVNTIGHCDDLVMPLIGTGRAAIREATLERVVRETIDMFLRSNDKTCSKLIICIRPKDYLEGRVDMVRIQTLIDYKCLFR